MSGTPLTGPPRVQIQTQSGCNGRCVFCPNEQLLKTSADMGKMPPELFQKIIDELAQTPPRRIMPYLQNESLNDKRIPEFVRYIAERIPDTTTLIVTNGTALSEEMGERLIDAGLKRLKVSLQSLDEKKNEEIMGYGAGKVVENVVAFKRLLKKKRSKLDLRVSMVVTSMNGDEIADARRFWKKHGIRLVTSALENRGGNIADAANMNLGMEMTRCVNCIRPSRDLCVLFDGRAILCCVDWFRTTVMGDLREQTVQEVWNNETYRRIREGLGEGDTGKLPEVCINCTESACPDRHRRGKGGWTQFKDSLLSPFVGKST